MRSFQMRTVDLWLRALSPTNVLGLLLQLCNGDTQCLLKAQVHPVCSNILSPISVLVDADAMLPRVHRLISGCSLTCTSCELHRVWPRFPPCTAPSGMSYIVINWVRDKADLYNISPQPCLSLDIIEWALDMPGGGVLVGAWHVVLRRGNRPVGTRCIIGEGVGSIDTQCIGFHVVFAVYMRYFSSISI